MTLEGSSDIDGYKLKRAHCGKQLEMPMVAVGRTFLGASLTGLQFSRNRSSYEASNTSGKVCHTSFVFEGVRISRGGEPVMGLSAEALLAPLCEWRCPRLIGRRGSQSGRMKRRDPVSRRKQLLDCSTHLSFGPLRIPPASEDRHIMVFSSGWLPAELQAQPIPLLHR